MLAGLPCLVWRTDEQLNVASVGGCLLSVFGVKPDDVVGRGVGDFFRGFGIELLASSAHRSALAGNATRFEFESHRRPYEARIEPFREDGRVIGTIGLAVDVSETRGVHEQLCASQRMDSIGRFAGRIAHDFNNVLSVIESYAALLANELPDARAREDVEVIRRAVRKAADMVSQLLAFSRRQARHAEPLDLNSVIRELGGVLERAVGDGAALELQLDGKLGSVVADRGQIEQVVVNLVTNASEASGDGGRIQIATSNTVLDELTSASYLGGTAGPYVTLSVTDEGEGMDRETQSRMFEPFFTTRSKGKASGLGLSMVYGIVQQSSGFLRVDSQSGHGSSFRVYLPRVDEVPVARETAPAVTSIAGNETILLVEDDDALRSASRRILRGRGYTILEARHGGEALLLCERYGGRIHLLLADLEMPQMSGTELWDKLRPVRTELKVVFMSGDGPAAERSRIDRQAVLLAKPFSPQELLDCVRRTIDRS
jgi:signal transduction histidine kinase